MRYTKINTNAGEYTCSAFAMGTHAFGWDKRLSKKDCHALMEQYIDGGGNIFDSGRAYGNGESEKIIGAWLSKNQSVRKNLIISTKGGQRSVTCPAASISLKKDDVYEDLQRSLEALRTDYIDFYFLHKDDTKIPVGEIMDYMNDFKKQGLIKTIAVSNWSTERICEANEYAKAHGLFGIEISQLAFSPYHGTLDGWGAAERCLEMSRSEYASYCENKIPVIAYNSQAFGFFYKNFDKPDSQIDASAENMQKLHAIRKICRERGIAPQEAVFGFFAGLEIPAVPLASTTSHAHMQEMLANCDAVLSRAEAELLLPAE